MILSIDPGVRVAGAALFEDKELVAAWLSKGNKEAAQAVTWPIATAWSVFEDLGARVPPETIQTLAMEIPEIYKAQFQKGDQQDNIQLAIMNGAMGGLFWAVPGVEVVTYLPKIWKRQVPKPVMSRRIQEKLDPEELSRVDVPKNKSYAHDVWHAIGVGLYCVGRL